jgi:hypothetical protein
MGTDGVEPRLTASSPHDPAAPAAQRSPDAHEEMAMHRFWALRQRLLYPLAVRR